MEDVPIAVLGLSRELFLQSLNNLLSIQLSYWESHNSPLYLGRGVVNCWDVPIIIGKREGLWDTIGVLVSYLLSRYGSSIEDWGTAGDVRICNPKMIDDLI